MLSAQHIIKKTLSNLSIKKIEATPKAYEKEFYEVAKDANYKTLDEIDILKVIQKLTKEERILLEDNKITTFEDISKLLLNRAPLNKVSKLSNILCDALVPSTSESLNKSIRKFNEKISQKPEILFQNDTQMELKKVIEHRIDLDQNILIEKTKDVENLMGILNNQVNEVVHVNKNGFTNISNISSKLHNIGQPTIESVSLIHDQLKNTTVSLANDMKKTGEKLKSGQNNINDLEKKIKALEKELLSTKKENEIDHLTSLYTRKAFEKYAQNTEEEYQISKKDYAIVFFDIDFFKKVNDTYGHEGGDIILSTFARVLTKSTRDIDIIGRYGGEEFIAIINFKKEAELEPYLLRIKNLITKNKFKYKEHKISITFSAGLTIRSKNSNYEETVNNADKLLYKAKQTGRNKIIFQNKIEI